MADEHDTSSPGRHGLRTTTLLVVTSMIGSGVFTTSGLLLADLGSPLAVLLVWILGGLVSLAGAWVYAELAVAVKESGGEYALVSRYVHPAAGFVVGLVTFVVGFCAPIAACAFAFARYASAALSDALPDPGAPMTWTELAVALAVIVAASLLHAREHPSTGRSLGVLAQDLLTVGKLALVGIVIVLGFAALAHDPPSQSALATASWDELARTSPLSIGLGIVVASFAYSGWNAAAYFAGEVQRPERTLPVALAGGTALVTVLYVLANVVFLAAAPREALSGQIVVGHLAARALYGNAAARALSAIIAFGLLSTVSAFVWTGLRILEAMGRHHARLSFVSRRPVALGLQLALSVGLLLSASFDVLLGSVGFAISIASALTVLAVFRVRREAGGGYRAPLHPAPALFYLALMVGIVVATLLERPVLAVVGLVPTVVGLVGYGVVTRKTQ
ncbi:MAG: amino acid permease [Sandaracinaceae bacterium]|nr:amino acid permease [Sandaracinaceae bacterium]